MENIRYINEIYENIYDIVSIVSVGSVTGYGKYCEITPEALKINVYELVISVSKVKKRYGGRRGDILQLHLLHYQIWHLTKFTFYHFEY